MPNNDDEQALEPYHKSNLIWDVLTSGDLKALEATLRDKPELVHAKRYGVESLIHVAAAECPDAIPILVKFGANVNQTESHSSGCTPLSTALYAAFNLAAEAVVFDSIPVLLSLGADPNIPDSHGETPLQIVLSYTDHGSSFTAELTKMFLRYGADPNPRDDLGRTALDTAYFNHDACLFHLLRQAEAQQAFEYSESALAILEDDIEALKIVFQSGVDVNDYDQYGYTALHIATATGNLEIAQYLFTQGANVHARSAIQDNKGDVSLCLGPMPIHLAANKIDAEMIRLLLKNGADVNAPYCLDEEFDDSPIITALWVTHRANRERAYRALRVLLEHGANLYNAFGSSRSALSMAAWIKDEEEVALLLKYGAGRSAEDLLDAMRSATFDNGYRNLATLWNAGRSLTQSLKLIDVLPCINWVALLTLLEEIPHLELNEVDQVAGQTPLLWVIGHLGETGSPHIWRELSYDERSVEQLLMHGADPNLRDHVGNTPLSVARARSLPGVVALLQQYGAMD